MRAFALKRCTPPRPGRFVPRGAGRHAEIVGDVREEDDVDVLENAGAHEVRLGAEQFLGDAGPQFDGAGEVLALHHLLHRHGGHDIQRHARVVAFAMAGGAFDHGRVIGDARLLRRLRDIVDVGAECDHRLSLPPRGDERGGNAGDAALDLEAFFFEEAGEVFGCLEFLESELAEAEDAVDHHLRLLLHAVDLAGHVGPHGRFPARSHVILRSEIFSGQQGGGESGYIGNLTHTIFLHRSDVRERCEADANIALEPRRGEMAAKREPVPLLRNFLSFLHAAERVQIGLYGALAEAFPVVQDVNQTAADMVRFLGGEKQRQIDLFLRGGAAGHAHLARVFHFAPAGAVARGQYLVGHVRVAGAGRQAVDLNVVIAQFLCHAFNQTGDGGLRRRVYSEVGLGERRPASGQNNNFSAAPLDHLRQSRAAGVHHAH